MILGTYNNGISNNSFTKLLLHMDGIDNGESFIDSSASVHAITNVLATKTKTAIKKFGTASGFFNGVSQYLRASDHADWDFGSSNFTIDGWIYIIDNTVTRWIMENKTDDTNFDALYYNATNGISYILKVSNVNEVVLSQGATISNNTWTHIAIVKNGNNYELFINGVSTGTSTYAIAYPDFIGYLTIGNRVTPVNSFTGYIEEIRITKGIALWNNNFTVPNRAS